MVKAISVLEILLPSFYAVCATVYLARFSFGKVIAPRTTRHPVLLTLFTHAVYMMLTASATSRCPLVSMRGGILFLAFAILLTYICLEKMSRQHTTGFVILPLTWGILAIGLFMPSPADLSLQQQVGPWLHVHAALALLGVAAMLLSAGHALLYLILHHDLKTGRFNLTFERLPPLETLERLTLLPAQVGMALFAIGLLLGGMLLSHQTTFVVKADPKIIVAGVALAVYLVAIVGAWTGRLRGRAIAIVSLLGFSFLCIAVGIPFVVKSFHSFH